MKRLSLTLCCSLLFLASCTSAQETMYAHARQKGSQAADKFFLHNLDQLCSWSTMGSVERALGDNPYKYREYKRLCGHSLYY